MGMRSVAIHAISANDKKIMKLPRFLFKRKHLFNNSSAFLSFSNKLSYKYRYPVSYLICFKYRTSYQFLCTSHLYINISWILEYEGENCMSLNIILRHSPRIEFPDSVLQLSVQCRPVQTSCCWWWWKTLDLYLITRGYIFLPLGIRYFCYISCILVFYITCRSRNIFIE